MVTSEQTLTSKQLETLCINTIRTLAMDASRTLAGAPDYLL